MTTRQHSKHAVNGTPRDENGLTARQRQVMLWAAKGHNSLEIGRALGISHYTVKHAISRAYKTLGINTRAELALEAQRLRLLQPQKAPVVPRYNQDMNEPTNGA